jgi:cytochrome c oxidase accessory protein FixG
MADAPHNEAPDRVLSTLNRDGSRRWLFPRLSPGTFLTWRRVVAYALIVIYNALPWIPINGKPSIMLDLPRREFTFFGTTFLPTDTLLLMLFMAAVFVMIFLVTALFGRLWCGWACPQTVYMEFVYRPIERLFDGSPDARGRGGAKRSGVKTVLKHAVFFVVSLHLAHTFLAYFVGAENLFEWTKQSPVEHPTSFIIVAAVTGLMMFDFLFFREQTCIVACPYGRFQSVMLDRRSLIISYDERRGEPRGKMRRKQSGDVALPQTGDCIDCGMCVVTCPTGIDIRDGLQMECIGCAQCIDACDTVMEKIKRPLGLIRYSSQEAMEQTTPHFWRPRVVLYPLLLTAILATFVIALVTKSPADIKLLRPINEPYAQLPSGEISNGIQVKIVNRTDATRTYTFAVEGIDGARFVPPDTASEIDAGATRSVPMAIAVPRASFELGRARIRVIVSDDAGFSESLSYPLVGPLGGGGRGEPAP